MKLHRVLSAHILALIATSICLCALSCFVSPSALTLR